jgi:hypothetical protein
MTDAVVPRIQTKYTPPDLFTALRSDWPSVETTAPASRASILTLLAQVCFETGWGSACWNWNLGNHKKVAGDGHDYYMVRCNEIIGGKVVWFDPPDPATWFRSYATLADGVREYLVSLRGRFGSSWPAVIDGNPAEFAHLLKAARYYTDDESHYTNSLVSIYHSLDLSIPPDASERITEPEINVEHPDVVADEIQTTPDELPPV